MPQQAFAILLGALFAFYGNQATPYYWCVLAPLFFLFSRFCPRWRFLLMGCAAYLWCAALLNMHLEHRLVGEFDGRVALLSGRIADIPRLENGRQRLLLDIERIAGYRAPLPRRAQLSWYQDSILPRSGETWQFEVRLKQPRGYLNPGGFDLEKWRFQRGIDAVGYIRDSASNYRLDEANRFAIEALRFRLAESIDLACVDCRQGGLIKALALGYRGDIDGAQRATLQHSGTAHLLAISGLHVGLVAMLAFGTVRAGWNRVGEPCFGRNRLSALVAIVAALFYAGLAGFSLPTVRALLMLLVVLLAMLLKSRVNLLQSLSLAVIAILLIDPRSVGSNSFWLSLGALSIIAFAAFRLGSRHGWWRQLVMLQACFSLLLAPFGAIIFGQFNPAGFFANLVAIPLVGFVVLPVTLLGCLLLAIGPEAGRWPLLLSDRLLGLLVEYLDLLLDSGLQARSADYPIPLLLLSLAALAWLLMPRLPFARGAALVALVVNLAWQPQRPAQGEFLATIFDVGMGTSVLLRTRDHALVYDFGPGRAHGYSASRLGLLPSIRRNRIGGVDLAVVSHVDQDHSGGLHAFLERFPDTRLVSGTPRELGRKFPARDPIRSCHEYPGWRWDGVDFRFLAADERDVGTNNRSCVLLVSAGHRLLLPGDVERRRESGLLARFGDALSAEVLVAPHHGSNTSSSRAFLDRVRPSYVVYTMARGNRWGFPSDKVSERYTALGTRQLRSDRDGAVTVFSAASGLSLVGARQPPKRLWRRW